MLKKFNDYLTKKKQSLEEQQKIKKAQSYYRLLKAGATFVAFVQQDIKQNGDKMNRHQRRRMETELEKGIITPELVQYYEQRIDYTLTNIAMRLNPPKPQKNNGMEIRTTPPPEVKK